MAWRASSRLSSLARRGPRPTCLMVSRISRTMGSMPDDTIRPLVGKVALVTGAARRVGLAIARELADAGAVLAIHYRGSPDEAHALAGELADARAFAAELGDAGQCARLVDDVVAWRGR